MDRRDFLKKAGVGTVALASFPALAEAASAKAYGPGYIFVGASHAETTPDGVQHRIIMDGKGQFVGQSEVRGSGSFVHWNNAPPGTPKPIIATGRWKATGAKRANTIGTYGIYAGGFVEMLVDLFPQGKPPISGATLKVVCNLGPAGLHTDEGEEGFYLTIPGGEMGTFEPFSPPLGVTIISL